MEAGAMFSEWQFPFRDTNQSSCPQSNPPSAAAFHILFCCQQAVYASLASAVARFSVGKGHRSMQPFFLLANQACNSVKCCIIQSKQNISY